MLKNIQMVFVGGFVALSSILHASSESLEDKLAYCGSIQVPTLKGIDLASGTIVGLYAPEGESGPKKAIGLTTAHTFLDETFQPLVCRPPFFSTNASIDLSKKGSAVERVYIPTDTRIEDGQGINDICLFTTRFLPDSMTVKVLPLYTGQGYKAKPNLEGMIVGYGSMYKAGATVEKKNDLKRHSGYTCTTFYSAEQDIRKRPVFRTFLRGSLTTEEILKEQFMNGFSNTDDDKLQLVTSRSSLFVCAHKNQSSPASGCSGGPLVFNTSLGPRVSGVFSQTSLETLGMSMFGDKPLVMHTFEAVPSHTWLLSCVEEFCTTGQITVSEGIARRQFDL